MTAVLHDAVVTARPARNLRVVRGLPPAHSAIQAPAPPEKKTARQLIVISDPLVDGAARLLSVPVRHVYAALWRVGLLEVRAQPANSEPNR